MSSLFGNRLVWFDMIGGEGDNIDEECGDEASPSVRNFAISSELRNLAATSAGTNDPGE